MKQLLISKFLLILFLSICLACSVSSKYLSISNNAYVASSILKTLGAKQDFETIMSNIQKYCPKLNVASALKKSINHINLLTSKKPLQIGYRFAKKALKKIFKRNKKGRKIISKRRRYNRPPYRMPPYPGSYPYNDYPYGGYGDYPNFVEKKGRKKRRPKKTPLKTNAVLKSLCKGVNYKNAKHKLFKLRYRMQSKKRRLLVRVIRNTLRRILARILGCRYIRKGPLAKTVRKALRKMRSRMRIKANVFKIAEVLKNLTNKKRKPKLIKKTNAVMKKVLIKLFNRKKVKRSTLILLNNLRIQNCKQSKKCFVNKLYSRKCYMHAQGCLKLRSLHRKARANKLGLVVSTLIKKFVNQ